MVAINDRVKETTTTTGQGTVDLGGAKTGFETFVERIGNGNQTYYCIAAEGGAEAATKEGGDAVKKDDKTKEGADKKPEEKKPAEKKPAEKK